MELEIKSITKKMNESITLDVNIGDTILMGKFLNKKVVVKSITRDEHGMPKINGKSITRFRIMKPKEESKMKKLNEFGPGYNPQRGSSRGSSYDINGPIKVGNVYKAKRNSKESSIKKGDIIKISKITKDDIFALVNGKEMKVVITDLAQMIGDVKESIKKSELIKLIKEEIKKMTLQENEEDIISMNVPLLLRLMEYSKEDAKTDMDLHNVIEKCTKLQGKTLTMDNYNYLIGSK